MTAIVRSRLLSQFTCLGDKCPDTCCQGWSMQLDEQTLERYKTEAPELLDAVEPGGKDAPWIMRKDKQTNQCVKLEAGWCGIYKAYGDKMLGDACHFYPRVTRALGNAIVMTAAPSCPEIVRIMLENAQAFEFEPAEVERLPHSLKDYLPEGMSAEDALAVHRAFLAACDDSAPVEKIFARIASVSRSIERLDKKSWAEAVPFYLQQADARLPKPEPHAADPFNLLHALSGLIVASHKPMSERLARTVSDMEQALKVKLDWQNVLINMTPESEGASHALHEAWKCVAPTYDPLLKRWLKMQLSLALHPFAGFGGNQSERMTIIGVRLATLRLALMSRWNIEKMVLAQEEVVRIVQSLARFLDHLGDPAFSLRIYSETGWTKESRMLGLLGI